MAQEWHMAQSFDNPVKIQYHDFMKERISSIPQQMRQEEQQQNPLAPSSGDDLALLMQQSPDVNIDLLVRKLELARKLAMRNDEPAAAISAINAMAKLHGLLVDKREMAFKRPEDMTEAELLKALGFDTIDDMLASNDALLIEHQASVPMNEPNSNGETMN